MIRFFAVSIVFVIFIAGCSYTPAKPLKVEPSATNVDYLSDIKPILDKRCVTCHSCYNSPCQAKFSSFEGIDRGASKQKVYLAERLFSQEPTRLFIDANSTQQWREKRFFSLTDDNSSAGFNNSVMGHILDLKQEHPEVYGEYAPEYDELICPQSLEEVSEYRDDKERHGMPYGFPALSSKEHKIMMAWLEQGAHGPEALWDALQKEPSSPAAKEIARWEAFLNTDTIKHRLSARYLYEHYFLAHIYFKSAPGEFYRLVRSLTPAPMAIDEIATLRPYDDPKTQKFYYRFQRIHSTLVHKTHIVLPFDETELGFIQEHFIDTEWIEKPHDMTYSSELSANPFLVYAQIPPRSRYALLLRHNEYFVRTFIRGPVCKGQIAVNVIHDHFWVMFQDIEADISVQDPYFLQQQAYNLSMPIEGGSDYKVYKVFSDAYRERYQAYYAAKLNKMHRSVPKGWGIEGIFSGKDSKGIPALTVYRHFDSASVSAGLVGEFPRTLWVIDYAHFERIYYTLVAGFDVFGNISHQTNIRRYMDFLRIEGELNFLMYLPAEVRAEIFASWYRGDDIVEDAQEDLKALIRQTHSSVEFSSQEYKRELMERLVTRHFDKKHQVHFDKYNYFSRSDIIPELPLKYETKEDFVQAIRALNRPGSGFVKHVVDNDINLALVRVRLANGDEQVWTLIINRWHDNVNSLFGEENRRDPDKDTLDIVHANIGSYPNIFLDVKQGQLPEFFDMLMNFEDNDEYYTKIKDFAISRSDERFWDYFDWFEAQFKREDPLQYGLRDLNRYYKSSWTQED